MSATKQRRWVCPKCGSGLIAPSRPRKDDVRRFCLPCSQKTGRLVERFCPAVAAQRIRKQVKRQEASATKREREQARRTERHTVGDLDIRNEWQRLCALPFVRARLRDKGVRQVPLTVSWSRLKDYTTGHAQYEANKVHLTFYHGMPRFEAEAVMAHELAHCVSLERGHGESFRRTFVKIIADAYGVELDWRGGDKFKMHVRVERALRDAKNESETTGRIDWTERYGS